MKQVLFFMTVALLGNSDLFGQKLESIIWDKKIGGPGQAGFSGPVIDDILSVSDGGTIVVTIGAEDSLFQPPEELGTTVIVIPLIIKFDKNGRIEWYRKIGGSQRKEWITDMRELADGSIVFAGTSTSNGGDVPKNFGEGDAWLIRLSKSGEVLTSQVFGGSQRDGFYNFLEINGALLAMGSTLSNDGNIPAGLGSGFYVQLDELGNSTDVVRLDVDLPGPTKIFDDKRLLCLSAVEGDTISIPWGTGSYTTSDNRYIFLDHDFNLIEDVIVRDTNYSSMDDLYLVDDGYIGIGDFTINPANVDNKFGAIKYDFDFNIKKVRVLGGSDFDFQTGQLLTTEGHFLMYGKSYSDDGDVGPGPKPGNGWLVCLDENLDIVWKKLLGNDGSNGISAMCHTLDKKGYWIWGYTADEWDPSDPNSGDQDFWLLRTGPELPADLNVCAEIQVSPNPFSGNQTLNLSAEIWPGKTIPFELFDALGRRLDFGVLNYENTDGLSFNAQLSTGFYFLKVSCESGCATKKIVKID